ncbi:MAG: hypothetical protein HUJ63_05020 [Enterococcus sp.]|nr:hypothetical protein [Enterococcus sp.]
MGEMNDSGDRHFIGIDPGKSGAMAVIRPDGTVGMYPYIPSAPLSYAGLFAGIECPRIVVERLFARPGSMSSAKANFELGRCMGEIETMLSLLNLPFQEVTPQAWQKEFGISGDKRTHVECARRLFPGVGLKRTQKCKVDFDGFADALLMAEYARRRLA